MFDPFRDFEKAGYLRNFEGEKDLDIVKMAEHELFRANLSEAVIYLRRRRSITYEHFCRVHHLLFRGLYPWAGFDRSQTAPDCAISKGDTIFAHPQDAALAVQEGLRLGKDARKMREHPGEVMGLFAFAHPFLDGNGRTMLLVHAELCRRAGFSVNWKATRKDDYLLALAREIASPGKRILDQYLFQFIDATETGAAWLATAAALPGLGGTKTPDEIRGYFSDPAIAEEYRQFEHRRGYQIKE
ncbi:Fic family protein [Pseudoduganella sp. LjRoot289]|uniref:Fic/DOC family protein n=1 Tax=Pseudoduganella sp. LjRoot289 TaxID=3342314 RepID=UPI003ECFFC59